MGETRIKVYLKSKPDSLDKIMLETIVDTGSTYSWVSKKDLAKIGVKPLRKMKFKTIKGEIIEREVGYLFIEWNEELAPTIVVFAEENDQVVIGLHALESLGLEVDPITRQVRKSEALLALATIFLL